MSTSPELHALRQEIAELRNELAEIKHQRSSPPTELTKPASDEPLTRRNWLKAAGAAAAGGAAAVVATAQPASADDPFDLTLGETKSTADRTQGNYTGSANGVGFLFQSGTTFAASSADFPAALGAYATRSEQPTGVFGFTNQADGFGVAGEASGGTGLLGRGETAALRLDHLILTEPPDRSDAHATGEIEPSPTTGGADLWTCVTDGSPGTWRKLAGPDTAGSLHPIEPTRIHDSRRPLPSPGSLSTGGSKVLSVATGRDVKTGAVTVNDLVPDGATAVAFNLTITQTRLEGFLSMTPGDAATFKASTINWFAPDQILANAGIVKLDANRQVKLFCGGGGGTHFVVDITGYYI